MIIGITDGTKILQPLIFCAPFYNLLHTIAAVVPHKFNVASKTPLLDALYVQK
jgi:hypothetical protein